MSDTSFPVYMHYGTNAERLAFVPTPPASGQPIYIWYETDTGDTYLYDSSWHQIAGPGGGAINVSAGTTSNNLTNLVFSNSNGVSFGLDSSTITASHDGLTTQLAQIASANNGSFSFTNLSFSNANGVSFETSAGPAIVASIVPGLTNVNVSAGTTSNNLSNLVFSNSNGVSFGLDGSTLTASIAAAGGGSINVSAGTTSNNLTNLVFSNANNVTFGLDGSTVTASASAGGGAGQTISYYAHQNRVSNTQALSSSSGLMFIEPVVFAGALSVNIFRGIITNQFSQYTVAGTSVNTTFTGSQVWTFGVQYFSQGTGASSLSFFNAGTATAGMTDRTIVGAGAVGSNYTVTYELTYPIQGVTSTHSATYAVTSASYVFSSSPFTAFSGLRNFDISAATVNGGNYWLGLAISSTSSNSGGPAGIVSGHRLSFIGNQQLNDNPRYMGVAAFRAWEFNQGHYATNSQFFSTNEFDFSVVATNGFQNRPIFELMRL